MSTLANQLSYAGYSGNDQETVRKALHIDWKVQDLNHLRVGYITLKNVFCL